MMAVQLQTESKVPISKVFTSAPARLLQRKCACGNQTLGGGECPECKKKISLQRKLTIGASNDPLEQEADRVADQVMSAPLNSAINNAPPRIQRFSGQVSKSLETAPPSVDRVLTSPGRAMEPTLRQDMEARFGHDFSQVRVHTGSAAEQSARDVNAHAYTVGHNIVFGAGRFASGSQEGRRLIAHELTHVVQQSRDATALNQSAVTSYQPVATLQRYKVPDNLKCTELVDWLKTNSPYAPEWAETKCDYTFNGQLNVSPPSKSGVGVSLTAKGHPRLTVSVTCPTDLPEWSPSGRDGRTKQLLAWMKMIAVLDKHEGRHRKIGQDWRKTLEKRFKSVSTTVRGTDEADAQTKLSEKLGNDQQKWQQEAQAAQSKIDPFRDAVLNCPEDIGMEEIAPQPDKVGEGILLPAPAKLDEPEPSAQPRELNPEIKELFP